MKKLLKAATALLLCSVMVLGMIGAGGGIFEKSDASTNGHTQAEAVAFVNNKAINSESLDYDNNGKWCIDLIYYYYQYLGHSIPTGNANTYDTNALPSGWSRVYSNPQPGDIYQTDAGTYGHVAVVTEIRGSSIVIVQQSENTPCYASVVSASNAKCYIRPDFVNSYKTDSIQEGIYYIQTKLDSNKYLDINLASMADGGNLDIYSFNGTNAQKFIIQGENGHYRIISQNSGKSLDVYGASSANGVNVQQYTANDSNAQQWYFHASGNGYYTIQSGVGTYMDIKDANSADTANVQTWEYNGNANQQFKLIPVSDTITEGLYAIQSCIDSNMFIDIEFCATENLKNVDLYSYNGSAAQMFTITKSSNGYIIKAKCSEKVLDVAGAETSNGTNIQQYDYNGSNAQIWHFQNAGNDYYYLRSGVGTYMDVKEGGKTNGTNIQTWSYNGNNNQKFKLLKAYTIDYNANGGTSAPESQYKAQGKARTLQTGIPTRNGYNFLGWSTNSKATTAAYQSGSSYTADSNATLYAVWQEKAVTPTTYTVTYNANGGSGAPAAQTKYSSTALTLSTVIPTYSGYTFTGWNTNLNGNGTSYAAGAVYTVDNDVTLYAQWKQNDPTHTHIYTAAKTVAPTCTEAGYTVYKCSCGAEYSTETVPALGHSLVYSTNSDGSKTGVCTRCGFTVKIPADIKTSDIAINNIAKYNNSTVDYKTTITFNAAVENSTGSEIVWYVNDKQVGTGESYTVNKATKDYTVYCTTTDGSGNTVKSETETIKVETGFFARLTAFFKGIFGLLPTIEQ